MVSQVVEFLTHGDQDCTSGSQLPSARPHPGYCRHVGNKLANGSALPLSPLSPSPSNLTGGEKEGVGAKSLEISVQVFIIHIFHELSGIFSCLRLYIKYSVHGKHLGTGLWYSGFKSGSGGMKATNMSDPNNSWHFTTVTFHLDSEHQTPRAPTTPSSQVSAAQALEGQRLPFAGIYPPPDLAVALLCITRPRHGPLRATLTTCI